MKFILTIILSGYLFAEFVDDSMNINYIPISAKSSAMGGIYAPYNIDKKIAFSHLSRFGGIYTLDAIQYNNILFIIHGVDDIANTTQAWVNIDNDGPAADEIDYSKINYFDVKDYNIITSKIIKNKYNFSIKSIFSKNYNRYGVGLGLNIVTTKRKYKWFDYYLGIYDVFSFKRWLCRDSCFFSDEPSDGYGEFYKPKIMISLERKLLKSFNVLTLYGMYKDANGKATVDYRAGSKISLTDNIDVFFGKSTFNQLSIGFSITNELFNVDYSYIISGDDLPFDDSYNIGIGVNISMLAEKGKDFYP